MLFETGLKYSDKWAETLFYIFEIKTILTGGFERSFNNIRSEITIGRYSNNFLRVILSPRFYLKSWPNQKQYLLWALKILKMLFMIFFVRKRLHVLLFALTFVSRQQKRQSLEIKSFRVHKIISKQMKTL